MTDRPIVLTVVVLLGFGFLGCLAGGFFLAAQEIPVPDYLIALGAGSLGALSSLLANTAGQRQSVQIDQPANRPVPVEDTDPNMP